MQHHANRLSGAFDGSASDSSRTTALSQQQIQTEIQRFESVHPRIYQIYDLLKKARVTAATDQSRLAELIEQIQEQVIGIEDAFVNSQEWTISRSIHEIRVGVIGSEDSCKNSLIHYFLTRNWNWEDAPEGGRFKKEVFIDGLSYLLLIRDEGSREPNIQFAHWFDALLIVFAIESHQSFNAALELHKKVQHFRLLDSGDVPVYLIGMRNMSQMTQKRAIIESDAQRMSKLLKMSNYFECADGSNVLRAFNSVCQRVVQQRVVSRTSSFFGIEGQDFDKASAGGTPSHHRHSGHYHQRSVSVLPANNDQQQPLFAANSNFPLGGATIAARSRTPRHDVVCHAVPCSSTSSITYHNNNVIFHAPQSSATTNFRHLNSYASFTPNSTSTNMLQNNRRRESVDQNWLRPVAFHHPQQQQFGSAFMAMPSTPSCSALLGSSRGVEPLAASTISPAFSHNNLSTAQHHHQQQHNIGSTNHANNNNNAAAMSSSNLMVAASPYTRSASSVIHSHAAAARHGSDHQQQCFYADGGVYNNTLVDPGGGSHVLHPLSSTTSSSTLVVNMNNNNGSGTSHNNNGNAGGNAPTTPGSTPNTQRKQHRRISNIFRKDNLHTPEERTAKSSADINLGVGRAIPVKQDYLYKKSKNGLNREWKKKYVCLYSDGRICYHQNLKEYAEKDSRGKEIYLGLATVRTSDRHRPKGGGVGGMGGGGGGSNSNRNSLLTSSTTTAAAAKDNVLLHHDRSNDASISTTEDGGYFCPRSPMGMAADQQFSEGVSDSCGDGGGTAFPPAASTAGGALATSTSSSLLMDGANNSKETVAAAAAGKHSGGKKQKEKKKRAKRIGSGGKNDEDDECCEFELISCDQKRWEFSARSVEERDEWVSAIEREIERCLQQQLSLKDQQQMNNGLSNGSGGYPNGTSAAASITARSERARTDIRALRRLSGNDKCADCGTPAPDWAAINFGTLICIECSGIHRMLGSHISKVRSLELDDWPPEHLAVMQAIGNAMANRVWQHNAPEREKPRADASREQKEQWIRTIYVKKLYLPSIPVDRTLSQQLVEAVLDRNIEQLLTVLPRGEKDDVNVPIDPPKDRRTVVHLACGIGAPEILQLLIWYNADLRALDEHDRNALWHANLSGSAECASILAQQGGLQSEQKQQQQQKHSPR
ncbi:ArfGAP with GTPase domain, ankyrin repeat and PH domain [Globodera pallida]|nr:ArfGAP with GTPase domain, ankyrin repeat and PH domain [Globodera pallida]